MISEVGKAFLGLVSVWQEELAAIASYILMDQLKRSLDGTRVGITPMAYLQ